MRKSFGNLLKYLSKLSVTEKEVIYQALKRQIDPTSSVKGIIKEPFYVRKYYI